MHCRFRLNVIKHFACMKLHFEAYFLEMKSSFTKLYVLMNFKSYFLAKIDQFDHEELVILWMAAGMEILKDLKDARQACIPAKFDILQRRTNHEGPYQSYVWHWVWGSLWSQTRPMKQVGIFMEHVNLVIWFMKFYRKVLLRSNLVF